MLDIFPCRWLPQIVERSFAQDIAKAYKADRPLDAAALNQVGGRKLALIRASWPEGQAL